MPGQKLVASRRRRAVEWLPRGLRYNEKLATPDVSIADLLGDIDPIKAATRKLTFADPEVIHFGIVPRTNRGIFAINELPDLAPRIQVGLLNILEERDLQIRGFPVRIPLDILLVFSANPEDYTNRGSIITPLKDRISSQILTHYPSDRRSAAQITEQEAWTRREHERCRGHHPRAVRSPDRGDQPSPPATASWSTRVPAFRRRMSISALELLCSNLERRALAHRRSSGLSPHLRPPHAAPGHHRQGGDGLRGRAAGRRGGGQEAHRRGGQERLRRPLPRVPKGIGSGGEDDQGRYADIVRWFAEGGMVTVTDEIPFGDYFRNSSRSPTSSTWRRNRPAPPATKRSPSVAELVLEGLHQHLKLAREDLDSHITYKEMVKFQLLRPNRSRRDDRGVN